MNMESKPDPYVDAVKKSRKKKYFLQPHVWISKAEMIDYLEEGERIQQKRRADLHVNRLRIIQLIRSHFDC